MRDLQTSSRLRAAARLLAGVSLFAFGLAAVRAQTPSAPPMRLARVEFEGLERVTRDDALARGGLQAGQTVTVEQIEEAAQRLSQSGLFRNLGYTIKGTTDAAVLTFKVEEMRWGVPVVFDNFIWFTDEELTEAVRRRVPTFDGTAPEGGGVTDEITRALQELLRSRNIEGTVEYMGSADAAGRHGEHVFTVKGAALRVCALSFPGARTVTEEELVRMSAPVFDNEYSRVFVSGFLASNLLPLYHERGLLRASFGPLRVTKAAPSEECAQGLAVAAPVDEGSAYVWGGAEWTGQQAMTPQELNIALGMRTRDVAGSAKLEKGLEAVRRAYGRKGYLTARVTGAPEFDDANRRVLYRFNVTEGPQYRMGALTLDGLDERDTNNMKVRWRILPGEVFDAGYPDEFVKKNVQEFARDLLRDGRKPTFTKAGYNLRVDNDKLTVDVTLEFKN
ncbi:MAG TPA: POTRA domain-containing protein [Pyrinomonadaceae bacterium]|nr:POTRA domain-containing protein [Pyrinomonadaceae bacterium]